MKKHTINIKNKPKKIGIFDSGVGGISILNELLKLDIPEFVYIADTKYLPYGQQTPKTLLERARVIANLFLKLGINTVVVACHTSSATTLHHLHQEFPQITFIDMLEPTIHLAVTATKNNIVGIFATQATINSRAHFNHFQKHAPHITVIEQACPALVPLIEKQAPEHELEQVLQTYLDQVLHHEIDTLILGCTHYPFVQHHIQKLAPDLSLIAASHAIIPKTNLAFPQKTVTFLTSSETHFAKQIERFLKHQNVLLYFSTF